jgi:Flp pilus assembly protein TadG
MHNHLWKHDKGGMAVLCAIMIPALIGLGTLTIDQGYFSFRSLLLKQSTENAALAAAEQLYMYYTTGSNATIVSTAQAYAGYNMPSAQYGTVVTASNVVLGSWNGTAFTAGGTNPTAVQVTGLNTVANGNAVGLFLGSFFGRPTADISYAVVASYGSGKSFNTIVINDMSQSFSSEIANQVTADQQILNCVKGVVGSTSYFGVTFANGHASTYIPLSLAQTNYTTLHTKVAAITTCSSAEDPNCSTGSNVGHPAIQQLDLHWHEQKYRHHHRRRAKRFIGRYIYHGGRRELRQKLPGFRPADWNAGSGACRQKCRYQHLRDLLLRRYRCSGSVNLPNVPRWSDQWHRNCSASPDRCQARGVIQRAMRVYSLPS